MTTGLSPQILLHIVTVVPALGLGITQLLRPKGSATHRLLGRIWVALMLVTAVSSFGIRRDGFSLIHALSVFTIIAIVAGLLYARAGNTRRHKAWMIGAFIGAIAAGIGALMPGRLLHTILIG
jgi:uncharacterized membrane protein